MSFRDLEASRTTTGRNAAIRSSLSDPNGNGNSNRSSSPTAGFSMSPVASRSTASQQQQRQSSTSTAAHVNLSESVKSSIFAISANIASIQRMTTQLGTARDTHTMRDKLESLVHQTQQLIKQTTQDLKALHDLPTSTDGSSGGIHAQQQQQQQRIRQMEQQKLSRDFQIVLTRFQQVQRQSAEKSREYVARAKQQSAHIDNNNDGSDDEDGGNGGETSVPLMQQQQQQRQQVIRQLDKEIEYNEAVIADREQSIAEIEHAIVEVNEIFRDLGTMVNDQQGLVDNIEANIESTAVRTGDANVELQTAEKYQKKARNRMFCLLLVLAVITIILTVVLIK